MTTSPSKHLGLTLLCLLSVSLPLSAAITFATLHPGLDPYEDDNGNGASNFAEYAAGLDPAAAGNPPIVTPFSDANGRQVTVLRRNNAADISSHRLQYSTTLLPGSWNDLIVDTDYTIAYSVDNGPQTALTLDLLLPDPILFLREGSAGFMSLVETYFANLPDAPPGGRRRLNDFFQNIGELTDQLHDAWLGAADMQNGDGNPLLLISGNTPNVPMEATWTPQVHGHSSNGGNYLARYDMPDGPTSNFTLLVFFANEGAFNDYRNLVYLTNGTQALNIGNTVGPDIRIRTVGTFPNADLHIIGSMLGNSSDRTLMFGVQWENGVGYKAAYKDSDWTAQNAYTKSILTAGGFDEMLVGSMPGTHQVILLFGGLLDDDELDTVRDAAHRYLVTSNVRCVVEGDSIWNTSGPDPIGKQIVDYIARTTGPFCGAASITPAQFNVGGSTSASTLARIEGGNLAPHAASGDHPQFFLCVGVNDLEGAGTSVQEILENISDALTIADSLGMKCYLATIHYSDTHTTARKADRDAINEAIRSKTGAGLTFTNYTVIDQDMALKTLAGAESYYDGPTGNLYNDNVHLREPAKLAIAREANSVAQLPRNSRIRYATWFNGSDRRIEYDTGSTDQDHFGACTIKAEFLHESTPSGIEAVFSLGDEAYRLSINSSNQVLLNGGTGGALATLTPGSYHAVEVDFDSGGNASALRINEVDQGISIEAAGSAGGTSTFQVGGASGASLFMGMIRRIEVTGANGFVWEGDGPYPTHWKDTSGNGRNGLPVNWPDRAVSYDDGMTWKERP